jgi:hypothetical protein
MTEEEKRTCKAQWASCFAPTRLEKAFHYALSQWAIRWGQILVDESERKKQ